MSRGGSVKIGKTRVGKWSAKVSLNKRPNVGMRFKIQRPPSPEADGAAQPLMPKARLAGKQRHAQEELVGFRRDGGTVAQVRDLEQVSSSLCIMVQFRPECPHDAHLHFMPVGVEEARGAVHPDEQRVPGGRATALTLARLLSEDLAQACKSTPLPRHPCTVLVQRVGQLRSLQQNIAEAMLRHPWWVTLVNGQEAETAPVTALWWTRPSPPSDLPENGVPCWGLR